MKVGRALGKVLVRATLACIVGGTGWAANPHESTSEAAVEAIKFGSLEDGATIDLYV